ncbi:hypothetical protein T484DRAFT_1761734, partial [Baffinella frigidus]
WTSDAESLPLTYSFATVDPDIPSIRSQLATTLNQAVVTELPPGDASDAMRLGIHLTVSDVWGSSTVRRETALVAASTDDTSVLHAMLTSRLSAALSEGDDAALSKILSAFGPLLNSVQGACSGVTSVTGASAACRSLLTERKAIRANLLTVQMALLRRSVATESSLEQAGVILKGLTQKPLEMDAGGVRAAAAAAAQACPRTNYQALSSAKSSGLRPAAFPTTLAVTMNQLLQAVSAGAGSPSSRRLLAAGITPLDSEARDLTREVLAGVAAVSSQSVAGAADGEDATELDGGGFFMLTARVATTGFTETSLETPGGAFAIFPPTLFKPAALQGSAPLPASAEIMLIQWVASANPAGGALGPIVTAQ